MSDDKTYFTETGETEACTPESGKIYIDVNTNITYRWGGSIYVPIGSDLALGITHSTAFYGDLGQSAYEHSISEHARADATKVEKSDENGNIKIDGEEVNVYTHPYKNNIYIGNVEPTDTNVLWLDTGNGGILKYYKESGWENIIMVWG